MKEENRVAAIGNEAREKAIRKAIQDGQIECDHRHVQLPVSTVNGKVFAFVRCAKCEKELTKVKAGKLKKGKGYYFRFRARHFLEGVIKENPVLSKGLDFESL